MDKYYAERYKAQLHAIADNVDELNIIVGVGCDFDLQHDKINVHYVRKIKQRRIGEEYVPTPRDMLAKVSGYHYWSKPYITHRQVTKTLHIEGDAILGFSGAGWQEYYHTLLGERKGIPVIHRMRGNGRYERWLSKNKINMYWNNLIESIAYEKYDYHIPISSDFRKILIQRGIDKDKISYPIGLGVDTELFKPDNSIEPEDIGVIGRLSKEKGSEFILEVMKQTPNLKYLVVGRNDLGLTFPDNVTYIGKVRKDKVPELINRCRFIVMPSLSEGVPNGILEAYGCGKMVIASPHAFRNDLPIFAPTIPLKVSKWVSVMNIMDMVNIQSQQDMIRRWALDNSWSCFGESLIKEIKKVI